jgi:hypothetical protein
MPSFYVFRGISKAQELIRSKLVPGLKEPLRNAMPVVLIRSDTHPNSESIPCIPTGTLTAVTRC